MTRLALPFALLLFFFTLRCAGASQVDHVAKYSPKSREYPVEADTAPSAPAPSPDCSGRAAGTARSSPTPGPSGSTTRW